MSDGVFNISKGAFVERIRDAATNVFIMLLQANEAEATLIDHEDIAALLLDAGNTEATFTNYDRKTGLTGTITVDHTNDRVDVDVADQEWINAGGAINNTMTKLLTAFEETASDAGRIPMTHHDYTEITSGSNISVQINAAGFGRAS